MASVDKDTKGWRIRFYNGSGDRKQIRLTGLNKAKAEAVGRHIDELVQAKTSGQPAPRQTSLWLSEIGEKLYAKLVKAGLAVARSKTESAKSTMLLAFIDESIADGKTLCGRAASDSTRRKWRTARNHLAKFFPARQPIETITPQDAKAFRQYLETIRIKTTGLPMRENAKRKIIASTKVIFNAAKRLELVTRTPFIFEASSSVIIRDRDFFITPAMAQKLLAAAPDTQWRLIIALWRLAGLRKMEIFSLTWADVLWDQGRFRVIAPKTRHIEGREIRFVPIIGPVLPFLEAAFNEAEEGETRVITRYRTTNLNLHKPFEQIIRAAGLKPWPKLIQNLS